MNTPSSSEAPSLAYLYDGTLEGLLTAVFNAYARREDPSDIMSPEHIQPRLGQKLFQVKTDYSLAQRVQRGVIRACGHGAFSAVKYASLSDDPNAAIAIYRFIRYAMKVNRPGHCDTCPQNGGCNGQCRLLRKKGSILSEMTNPIVEPIVRLSRAVDNERHRILQFLRFQHLEGDLWLARCNPSASVIPLVMDHFVGRFNTQPFIIYDEIHNLSGVYEGRQWYLVKSDCLVAPPTTADEEAMAEAWRRFYQAISIESHYNPELRRQFMPKRLWRNLTEFQMSQESDTQPKSDSKPLKHQEKRSLPSSDMPTNDDISSIRIADGTCSGACTI